MICINEQIPCMQIYEQTGRSSTKEGPEDLILLKANEETGESTVPDLIEEDPIRHGKEAYLLVYEDIIAMSNISAYKSFQSQPQILDSCADMTFLLSLLTPIH